MMYGTKTRSAYSSNVTASLAERRCTTAAPSRTLTSKLSGKSVSDQISFLDAVYHRQRVREEREGFRG